MDELAKVLSFIDERKNFAAAKSVLKSSKCPGKITKSNNQAKQRQSSLLSMFPKCIEEEEESVLVALSLSMQDQGRRQMKGKYSSNDSQVSGVLLPHEAQAISTTRLLTILKSSSKPFDVQKFKRLEIDNSDGKKMPHFRLPRE
ncbi:hypothetical protein DI09_50p50 [Mitosporidium daphniae]|uniref:Uncharacterized protein n=1 Tax=Mitosporidium daphniae TaxID=1485682 RepID=A0A098VPH0_9MICR|nr:uncharacterized protein DI09_50p50 [Mitosporidium daphniae]KGG50898.1 hypothetical protein DI09_50p50 [Mitosporidium daphniae]|eukprot:XP_013237344.1 uncharacterized protein DI09_50p50 [Mitosporidium daphniae]